MPSHPRSFLRCVSRGTSALLLLAGSALPSSAFAASASTAITTASTPPDAIALAVVFDTSGSVRAAIPTKPGSARAPKIDIARRVFADVIDRLKVFSRSPGAKPLFVSITVFRGNEAHVALPLASFHAERLRTWLAHTQANSATPLGAAIALAGRDLLASPAASRHLLVLTDGMNSTGPKPEVTLAALHADARRAQKSLFVHIIALDIKPNVFAALQKQGATLIGAADEAQLHEQFDFILEEKILVEAPRPAR